MKKNQKILTGVSLAIAMATASVAIDNNNTYAATNLASQVTTNAVKQTQQNVDAQSDNSVTPTQTNVNQANDALDQVEAEKQAQNQEKYDQLKDQTSKTQKGFSYFTGQYLGDYSEKPTDNYSSELAKKLYEARDARNQILLDQGGDAKLSSLDKTMSMISDYSYNVKDPWGGYSLATSDTGIPKRSDDKNVPQDDQFYIDWLDHEVKLAQGEKETYQVPDSYNELLKELKQVASYGGDAAKLSDSYYTEFYGLPGFKDWENLSVNASRLQIYPGTSEYDVKFYTPFLTDIINDWNQKTDILKQEYAAKNESSSNTSENDSDNVIAENDNSVNPSNIDTKTMTTGSDNNSVHSSSVQSMVVKKAATVLNQKSGVSGTSEKVTTSPVEEKQVKVLPQTGNANNKLVAGIGLGLLTLTAMFGLSEKRQF